MPRPKRRPASGLLAPAQAREIFAYNIRLFDRFVRRVRRLPWRTVRRRREIGHQSLFQTLVHVLNVHEVWVGYVLPGRSSDPELERLFADPVRRPKDWRGFRTYEARVWGLVNDYLAHVTPSEMRRPVKVFWMPGRYVVSDGLLQTTFEQAHHLGEIIAALWQDDIEPPPMTWIEVANVRRR